MKMDQDSSSIQTETTTASTSANNSSNSSQQQQQQQSQVKYMSIFNLDFLSLIFNDNYLEKLSPYYNCLPANSSQQ